MKASLARWLSLATRQREGRRKKLCSINNVRHLKTVYNILLQNNDLKYL